MDQTIRIISEIKSGKPFNYPGEGKVWTIEKKGSRFKLTHDKSEQSRSLKERHVQQILNKIIAQ